MNKWQKVINVSLAVIVTLLIYQNQQLQKEIDKVANDAEFNEIDLNLVQGVQTNLDAIDVLKELVEFNREDIEVTHENTEKLYAKSEDAREVINTLIDQSNENKSKISEVVIFLDGVYNN
tara:strand:+ start:229 stop:588 length:360 start_codon:yes stop_codon:yes gene_type:complete